MPVEQTGGEFLLAALVALVGGGIFLVGVILLTRENRLVRLVVWLGRWLPGGVRQGYHAGEPLPDNWERAIRENVEQYALLSGDERRRLHELIPGFLEGKEWVGCNSFEVTEEVKATIAAQACVLLLGSVDHDYFASVKSVLIYPTTFNTPTDPHAMEGEVATLGQAWYRGPVILAWDDVLASARHPGAGHNVVYHEFAHQLDFAGESLERATDEGKRRRRNEVLHGEFDALVRAAERGRATLLDQYGATNPREFFAVATECFFLRPAEMRRRHPALYDVLREFYGQDPEARLWPVRRHGQ